VIKLRLVYNILNEQLKIDEVFNKLKMLTNCDDDYLNQLKIKSQESGYTLLDIINQEIYIVTYGLCTPNSNLENLK
jgi:hypothetical protein